MGKMEVTPGIALRLAAVFDTTPNLWLNLQQKYDLWIEEKEKPSKDITPLYKATVNRIRRRKKTAATQ